MIDRLLTAWRQGGVAVNAGASIADLDWLADHVGAPLPDDVREYFRRSDGMADDSLDEHVACFWSIERIRRETGVQSHWAEARLTPIADVLIDSWFICLRRNDDGRVVVASDPPNFELASFSVLIERYLTAPETLGL